VYFGEHVPRERVQAPSTRWRPAMRCWWWVSSLMVYSGFRFAQWAHKAGKPIAALNRGRTRADALLTLKVEHDCAQALAFLLAPPPRAQDVGREDWPRAS